MRGRSIPQSDLDFNLMTTDTVWGSMHIPEELRVRLERNYVVEIDGKQYVKKEGLWQMLGFYTRDLRLANLSQLRNEVNYVNYHLDLANDMLREDFIMPFLICLSRAATVLEVSQSVGGFLRKRMNTFTHESYQQELEPPKKNFFGMAKKTE
jgi:hypothetical protein